jgi:MoxR-like ATPase
MPVKPANPFIDIGDGLEVALPPQGGIADQAHLFEPRDVIAINAALAAGRPLLVRGDPGTGKSQLARAAAVRLGRAYVQLVVDSQTESRDLLWQFDALGRLAEAQLAGALKEDGASAADVRAGLAVSRFLRPGPLWWGFHWEDAAAQAGLSGTPLPPGAEGDAWRNGCVVLIDEIDKAESEVPNGLLEALGAGEMTPPGRAGPVKARPPLPLVVITTNGERALPDAFVRRCLVLGLALPPEEDKLKALLIRRGAAHFPRANADILAKAADLLAEDRRVAIAAKSRPFPGQAEYLDLLRAVLIQYPHSVKRQQEALEEIAEYTLRKHAHL